MTEIVKVDRRAYEVVDRGNGKLGKRLMSYELRDIVNAIDRDDAKQILSIQSSCNLSLIFRFIFEGDTHLFSPVTYASFKGALNCLRLFLVDGYAKHPTLNEDMDCPALHAAAKRGDLQCIQLLVEEAKISPNSQTKTGRTPLHYAAMSSSLDACRYFVETCECDVDIQSHRGWTALHWACYAGNQECVKYLIQTAHSNMNKRTNKGWTPLHWACYNGCLAVVRFMIQQSQTSAHDTDANDGWTCLHFAAHKGHIPICTFLVHNCNVDVRIKNKNGQTAHDLACKAGEYATARYLQSSIEYKLHANNNQHSDSNSSDSEIDSSITQRIRNMMSLRKKQRQQSDEGRPPTISTNDNGSITPLEAASHNVDQLNANDHSAPGQVEHVNNQIQESREQSDEGQNSVTVCDNKDVIKAARDVRKQREESSHFQPPLRSAHLHLMKKNTDSSSLTSPYEEGQVADIAMRAMDSVSRLTDARQEIQEIKNLHKTYVDSLQCDIKRMNNDLHAKTDQISSLLKEVGRQRAEIERLRSAVDGRSRPNSRQYPSPLTRYPSYQYQQQHVELHPSRYRMDMPPVVTMTPPPRNLQRSATSAAPIRPINSVRRDMDSKQTSFQYTP